MDDVEGKIKRKIRTETRQNIQQWFLPRSIGCISQT